MVVQLIVVGRAAEHLSRAGKLLDLVANDIDPTVITCIQLKHHRCFSDLEDGAPMSLVEHMHDAWQEDPRDQGPLWPLRCTPSAFAIDTSTRPPRGSGKGTGKSGGGKGGKNGKNGKGWTLSGVNSGGTGTCKITLCLF